MHERVLLVDDEEDFLEALSERMRTRGMEVTCSTSAREALKLIEEKSFDVVMLDFQMPEMDGLHALRALKEKRPELQVILLTGHGSVERGVEAMKSGASDFVEKPADFKDLTEKISSARAKKMLMVESKMEEEIRSILRERGW